MGHRAWSHSAVFDHPRAFPRPGTQWCRGVRRGSKGFAYSPVMILAVRMDGSGDRDPGLPRPANSAAPRSTAGARLPRRPAGTSPAVGPLSPIWEDRTMSVVPDSDGVEPWSE